MMTVEWGSASTRGDCDIMQDTHTTKKLDNNTLFCGVYDGHANKGEIAAHIAQEMLHEKYQKSLSNGRSIKSAFKDAFESTDLLIQQHLSEGGTTAVSALFNQNTHECTIAWAGDSRAVIIRDGKPLWASADHTPQPDNAEGKRILKAGCMIRRDAENPSCFRIAGLAMSRTLGDVDAKNWCFNHFRANPILATPDIHALQILPGDQLVIACDGVWDVLKNKQVAELMHTTQKDIFVSDLEGYNIDTDGELQNTAKLIVKRSLQRGSTDNITAVVARFGNPDLFANSHKNQIYRGSHMRFKNNDLSWCSVCTTIILGATATAAGGIAYVLS